MSVNKIRVLIVDLMIIYNIDKNEPLFTKENQYSIVFIILTKFNHNIKQL